jgi:hypothetical protein
MDQDSKLLKEAYQKMTKLDEFAFPSRGGGWKSDGEIADAILDGAEKIAGLAVRTKLTNQSKYLQRVYFDVVDIVSQISR